MKFCHIWEKEELNALPDACKEDARPILYPFFRLPAFTDMRIGEIPSPTLENVDLDSQAIEIKQVPTTDDQGKTIPATPKIKSLSAPCPSIQPPPPP
ncbi:hypothetical protein ACKQTC_05230 [Peptococcus simiae]|uniref:Uncharacterized protein n=1 Tax=Peptococcus simiae TaxID=1643805 RepID=A0ABW9GZN7_9FIRM